MANKDMRRDVAGAIDEELTDDGLCNLFAAFDEVSASDELRESTLARILSLAGEPDSPEESTAIATSPSDANPDEVPPSPSLRSLTAAAESSGSFEAGAVASGKSTREARRAKWRAIRVAAIAACLALALSGGVAYAVPASYYDVAQGGSTVTLGVNVFGVTVSATSDDEAGAELVASTELRNMPYEESLARAIGALEERNPDAPVEFGPQGGEREVVQHQGEPGGGEGPGGAGPNGGEGRPDDMGQPGGAGRTGDAGQAGGSGEPASEGTSDVAPQKPEGGAGGGGASR